MVTDDSQSLDEYILQIFEEQEEVFYFPVTSQNTARNFIKALHNKGLPYERVCKEIGEFEHNFSAWRKGLGRVGIGNRVIQRINRPLEAVLLSDDEDDVLARLKDRVRDARDAGVHGNHVTEGNRIENDRVPPVGRHRQNKQDLEQGLTDSWRHCIDAKMRTLDDTKMTTTGDAETSSTDDAKTRTPEISNGGKNSPLTGSTGQLSRTSSGQLSRTSSVQLSRKSSSQLSGAELEQKEPGVIDFRSVLKRHVENDKLKLGDRRSMPPSLWRDHDNDNTTRSRLSTSLDTIHRAESTAQNTTPHQPFEGRKTRAGSEPRDTQYHVEARKTEENTTKVLMTGKTSEAQQTSVDKERLRQQTRKMSDSDHNVSDSDDSNQEPLPHDTSSTMDARKDAPLAAEETDSVSSEIETETTSASESETESESESEKTGTSSRENDNPDGRDDDIQCSDDDDDDDQETQESCEAITENYDSEWDEENSDLSAEGRRLAIQIAEYKRRLSQSDGAGFIWVFSDNPEDAPSRIKVGASRFPKRRLEQALCLNINMNMLASFRVRSRNEMLDKVRESLRAYKIEGHKDWYQGEITNLLDVIKTTIQN